ncbi:hypothetical protein CWR48_04530 [Oceanobacillus arenosus]|uniref:Uncharacterized protein n=1 Tax=Oceanobacillus arenosus TaxID=1229153 RepID=A0A3D8PXK3_9BACI|nr:hypothetical protein CWR48_04530 [Oceanobacillus arenosus]
MYFFRWDYAVVLFIIFLKRGDSIILSKGRRAGDSYGKSENVESIAFFARGSAQALWMRDCQSENQLCA